MENQYSYGNNRDRQYGNMMRTMQSPPVAPGPHGRFDGGFGGDLHHSGMHRGGMISPQAYGSQPNYGHSTQLPPLHTRDEHAHHPGGYGQMPPRQAHSPPVSSSMGYSGYMPQSSYQPSVPQFSNNTPLPPYSQASHLGMQNGVMSYPNAYHSASTGMPDMRGMTATSHAQSMSDPMAPQSYHMAQPHDDYSRAQHVVGAQGRRGILPSDDGRPPAVAPGRTARNAVVPQKDENGKFPCTHCTKTYLHAKHLKRHMLRHTGDRPYSCVLCNDTFSRSDILKRHFAKCSARRGNPNGMTHLSNSPSYLRKQAKARANSQATAGSTDGRPATSASGSSGASSQASGNDIGLDHPATVSSPNGPNSSAVLPNPNASLNMSFNRTGSAASSVTQSAPQSAVSQFGPSGILHSPVTSPENPRPPMGYYDDGSAGYHHPAYLGS